MTILTCKRFIVLYIWSIILPHYLETKPSIDYLKYKNVQSFSKCASPNDFKRKPLILVPGILGSQLEAKLNRNSVISYFCDKKSDWYGVWLNEEQLLPFVIDCWVDNIRMNYNNVTRQVSDPPGVTTRVPNFGTTTAFEYLDTDKYALDSTYFAPLVTHLTCNLGYTRMVDLNGAPFDWRVAPHQQSVFFKNLTKLIEDSYYRNGNQKVVLLGHSLGNMFIYYFLQRQSGSWKDKFIGSHISISGPYLGSVKALKALTSGDTEGHDFVLPTLKLRTVLRSASAFPFVLPRPDMWPVDKKLVLVSLERNYTVNDYKALFERIDCTWCYDMWLDNGMAMGDFSPPSVPVHCIYSSQVPTPETLLYLEKLFPDTTPSFKDGSGDGTVNVWSSSACLQWQGKQKYPVHKLELPGNDHVKILWNTTLHRYLDDVLIR